ncbi:hypothetical protein AB6A40_001783 [Gnathostoma spinigerum]|uniref:Ig-like domain-containing protein n=1 Tax=Gnathostoma spinigerum TaxID=75299 RepID=A0ABD6E510_9BILA
MSCTYFCGISLLFIIVRKCYSATLNIPKEDSVVVFSCNASSESAEDDNRVRGSSLPSSDLFWILPNGTRLDVTDKSLSSTFNASDNRLIIRGVKAWMDGEYTCVSGSRKQVFYIPYIVSRGNYSTSLLISLGATVGFGIACIIVILLDRYYVKHCLRKHPDERDDSNETDMPSHQPAIHRGRKQVSIDPLNVTISPNQACDPVVSDHGRQKSELTDGGYRGRGELMVPFKGDLDRYLDSTALNFPTCHRVTFKTDDDSPGKNLGYSPRSRRESYIPPEYDFGYILPDTDDIPPSAAVVEKGDRSLIVHGDASEHFDDEQHHNPEQCEIPVSVKSPRDSGDSEQPHDGGLTTGSASGDEDMSSLDEAISIRL